MGYNDATTTTPPIDSFALDIDVKEKAIMIATWHMRQLVLTRQTLEVLGDKKPLLTCDAAHCSVRLVECVDPTRAYPFEILVHGKVQLSCNSATGSLRDALITRLEAIALGQPWPSTTTDAYSAFVSVARALNETVPPTTVPRTNITINDVLAHLSEMRGIYEIASAMPSIEDLYAFFLDLERDYVEGDRNFAHTVHVLHPLKYQRGRVDGQPLADLVRGCPHTHCRRSLPLQLAYRMHILGDAIVCPSCQCGVLYETYSVAAFVAAHPLFPVPGRAINAPALDVAMPPTPSDGTWKTYIEDVKRAIVEVASQGTRPAILRVRKDIRAAI